MMHFRTIHPDWMPADVDDDDASAYVNRVNDPLRSVNAYRMGVTNARRPSQPFLGFAASSSMGQGSRVGQSRPFPDHPDVTLTERNSARRTQRAQVADSDLLKEMDERVSEQQFDSELGDSFITPSRAVDSAEEEIERGNQGVLGLLNHLYQETGTGKGIGM